MSFKVGVAAGCYSLLHFGHIKYLEIAKQYCNYLIALTNTDDRVLAKKGCVPISVQKRLSILRAIKYVDEVSSFEEPTEATWVAGFKLLRLHQEFGKDAKIVVFHTPEVENNPPCKNIVDEIVYIPRTDDSVTEIFKIIRRER